MYRIGYTAGAFDLFHIGHLNLLMRSKATCRHLIVGVTVDELILETKKKPPFIPFTERMAIVEALKCVDEVIVQDDLDKVKAWYALRYNALFSGDDWKGNPRWVNYERQLEEHGVPIVYFPYSVTTSSTSIQRLIQNSML